MTPAQRKRARLSQMQRGAYRGAGVMPRRGGAGQTSSGGQSTEIQPVRVDPVKTAPTWQNPAPMPMTPEEKQKKDMESLIMLAVVVGFLLFS